MNQTQKLIQAKERYINAKKRNKKAFDDYSCNRISKSIYDLSKIPLDIATKNLAEEAVRVLGG